MGGDGFQLPSPSVAMTRMPLVLHEAGAVTLVVPEGAEGWVEIAGGERRSLDAQGEARQIPFPAGSRAHVEAFGVVFCVSLGEGGRPAAGRWFFDRKNVPFVVASAALQLGLLGALSCFSAPPRVEGEVPPEQIYAMQIALAAVDEKQLDREEADRTAELADDREIGTGIRAKGEEGATGAPAIRTTGMRYGTRGPSGNADPHLAREAALRDASEFGLVGLLHAGGGASEPRAAQGNTWGASVDGSEGLELSGIGEVGGGPGLGSIGTFGHGAGRGSGSGSGLGFGSAHGRLGGSHFIAPSLAARAPSPSPPPPLPALTPVLAAPASDVAIDPNGRFATTYRPGGGHLAAFESAVARGIVPGDAWEVVGDVGARYTPAVAVPAGKALGLRADLERGKLAPGGGAFHLRLALQSTGEAPAARPHLSVHLVLDVSGSMAGESINRARDAAEALVDKLEPTDDFSLTTFSSDAAVRVADGPVGPRRHAIKAIIERIGVGGGTNIGEGLLHGYEQASTPGIPEDAVRLVLLLSDGQANEGITGKDRLSGLALGAFQHGIQTSAFGLGADYDGALMS